MTMAWLTVIGGVLQVVAPIFLQIMKAWGVKESKRQAFQDWVSDIQRRKNDLTKVKNAGDAQDADIAERIKEAEKVSPPMVGGGSG